MDRSTKWTSALPTLGILVLGLTARMQAADAGGERSSDSLTGEAVNVVTIFNTGFETGDSSDWSDTTPNSCPAPTGGPTLHANAVAPNEIWTAEGSPHILTNNVTVPPGVTLTVSPCAELRLRPNVHLYVQGTLAAHGTPLRRITIHRDDPALPFAYLWVVHPGSADVAFADISGGGSSDAALVVQAGSPPLVRPVTVDHVKVTGSAGYGVRLYGDAGFTAASRDLVVSGSGATQPASPFPVRLGLTAVGTLPTGSYTGNASDLVQVVISANLPTDLTFHDRGVPYQLGGSGNAGVVNVVGSPSLATLTLEAGVELQFYSSGSSVGGLFLGANSRLVAVGTAAAPIRLTAVGAAPPPGSWEGVTFATAVDPGTLLDHLVIDAAGAHGGDQGFGCPPAATGNATDGALKIFVQPASEFLLNSTISNSSSHGVFRAWTGTPVDFLASNSFSNIAGCRQVLPHPPPPANCPVNPECP